MKKRYVVVLYAFIILILLSTSAFATNISGSINLTVSDTTVSAGDELTVTLSLEDINAPSGVDSIDGYININENVIEDLTVESIVTDSNERVVIDSNNSLRVYDANDSQASSADTGITFNTNPITEGVDYKIVIDLAKAISSDTNLVTITFKVKDGVTAGTYNDAITYTSFMIYQGTTDKSTTALTTKSVNLRVEETNAPSVNDPDDENGNTTNNVGNNVGNNIGNNAGNNVGTGNTGNTVGNNAGNNSNNSNRNNVSNNGSQSTGGTNNQSDNTVATGRLPNTGYRFVILPILAITIAGLIFYKKYKKYSKF